MVRNSSAKNSGSPDISAKVLLTVIQCKTKFFEASFLVLENERVAAEKPVAASVMRRIGRFPISTMNIKSTCTCSSKVVRRLANNTFLELNGLLVDEHG